MSVRASLLCALLVAGAAQSGLSQDAGDVSFAPELRPVDDFAHIWTRSPFVVESKVVNESQGLAQRYSLAAIAMLNGEPRVILVEKATQKRLTVPSRSEAIEVVSVSMDREIRKSSAVIRLGGEQASITYDESLLTQIGGGVAVPPMQGTGAARLPRPQIGQPPAVPAPPQTTAVPPPPSSRIVRPQTPGVPTSPEEDSATEEPPRKSSVIRRQNSINTQN